MNPVLLRAIRERMREQSTEELRALWVTNDRVTWSSEAFEVVKSLLGERGVTELPPQNDPAPVARRHVPSDVPENVYWLGWLRPVLWIGIAVSCLTLTHQALAAWAARDDWTSYWLDEPWDVFVGTLQYILLPAFLIAASVTCFRFATWSRAALLTYAWIAILVLVLDFLTQSRRAARGDTWGLSMAGHAVAAAHQLALPVVLLVLLRRPEIRSVFTHARPGSGFEPIPAETTAAAEHG
jgi:hypothetical protein